MLTFMRWLWREFLLMLVIFVATATLLWLLSLAGGRVFHAIDAWFLEFHDEERCTGLESRLSAELPFGIEYDQINHQLSQLNVEYKYDKMSGTIEGYTRSSVWVGPQTTRHCQVRIALDEQERLSSIAVEPVYRYHGL